MLSPVQRRRLALAGVLAAVAASIFAIANRSSDGAQSDEPVLLGLADGEDGPASALPDPEDRRRATRALRDAVAAGPRHDGRLEIALMEEGWPAPIVRTSDGGRAPALRAWSVSKVFTAVALLGRLGWGDEPGATLSPEVAEAIERALTRSENCPQRHLTLELQRLAGGTPESAGAAIETVLRRAGATRFTVATQAQTPEPLCVGYLERTRGVLDPQATALLAGTSTWTVGDAARFALALGTDVYGEAVARRLLGVMRQPKLRSEEIQELDFTAPLDWGLGSVLGAGRVAYKAGWGGALQGTFVAEQIGVVSTEDGRRVALAVAFHPNTQPPRDDPGVTQAPAALAEAAAAVKAYID